VATTRSRAVATAVSALAFFGIGAAIGARATSVTSASAPVTTARVANPVAATYPVPTRSREEDDEGGVRAAGATWQATPGTTTVRPGQTTTPVAPSTTSGGSVAPV